MTMQMQRAFNARMQTSMTLHKIAAGAYDSTNNWVPGTSTTSTFSGIVFAGNKFSQFDEGIALHSEDGGARFSNYRKLYVKDNIDIELGDKISYRNTYYNVLQESDERIFGFASFILEKSEDGIA